MESNLKSLSNTELEQQTNETRERLKEHIQERARRDQLENQWLSDIKEESQEGEPRELLDQIKKKDLELAKVTQHLAEARLCRKHLEQLGSTNENPSEKIDIYSIKLGLQFAKDLFSIHGGESPNINLKKKAGGTSERSRPPVRHQGNQNWQSFNSRKCPKCGGNHRLSWCDAFKEMKAKKRKAYVQKRKLCFKCLEPHLFRTCTQRNCPDCGGAHHVLICPNERGSVVWEKPNPKN